MPRALNERSKQTKPDRTGEPAVIDEAYPTAVVVFSGGEGSNLVVSQLHKEGERLWRIRESS
jgi:hypothetical protein